MNEAEQRDIEIKVGKREQSERVQVSGIRVRAEVC